MTHVEVAGGVGKHVQDVASFRRPVVLGQERPVRLPKRLPSLLSSRRVVAAGRPSALGCGLGDLRPLYLVGHSSVIPFGIRSNHLFPAGMKKPLAVEARGAAAQVLPARLGKERNSVHEFRVAHRVFGNFSMCSVAAASSRHK